MAGKHHSGGAKRSRRALATVVATAAMSLAWVLVAITGDDGTYAAWSASVTIPGATVHTSSASLSVTSPQALGYTFSSGALSTVGSVTVTNTGAATLNSFTPQVTLAGATTTLAPNISVAIWKLASGTCQTPPAGTPTYNWTTIPSNWFAQTTTLAHNDSATYCFYSSMSASAVSSFPSLSVVPTISMTGTTEPAGAGWSTGKQAAPAFTLATAAAKNPFTWNDGVGVTYTSQTNANGAICYVVQVSSLTGSKVTWALTVDSTLAPFNTTTPDSWQWPNGVNATWYTATNPARVILGGIGGTGHDSDNNGNNKTVSSGISVTLNFCVGGK